MEPSQGRRERIRFDGLDYETRADGSTQLDVRLEWENRVHRGSASGTGTLEGDLRAAAEATLAAARSVEPAGMRLELRGIKAVRVFDGRVIIASVEVWVGDLHFKLLGAHALIAGDVPRGAVLTVLDALNRVMGRALGTQPRDELDPSKEEPSG